MSEEITIRKATRDDLIFVKKIETECGLSPWSAADYESELAREDSIFNIILKNSELAGYIIARLITIEHSVSQINNVKEKYKKIESEKGNVEESQTKNKLENENKIENEIENKIENEIESEKFIELFNIGISEKYRRIGLGSLLLEKLIYFGAERDAEYIILEVRKRNDSAVELYNGKGFRQIFERKNFYHTPPDDGLVMKLDISKNRQT